MRFQEGREALVAWATPTPARPRPGMRRARAVARFLQTQISPPLSNHDDEQRFDTLARVEYHASSEGSCRRGARRAAEWSSPGSPAPDGRSWEPGASRARFRSPFLT